MSRGNPGGLLLVLSLSLAAPPAHAQAPPGSDTLSARAVAESVKVLAHLESVTHASPQDTAAWFHRGMIAFSLGERARAPKAPQSLDPLKLNLDALDAFRRAVALDANDPQHWLWLGRLRAARGDDKDRSGSAELFEHALALFRKTDQKTGMVDLLLAVGSAAFSDYEEFGTVALGRIKEQSLSDIAKALAPTLDAPHQTPLNNAETSGTHTATRSSAMPTGARPGAQAPRADSLQVAGSLDPPLQETLGSVSEAAASAIQYGLARTMARAAHQVLEVYGPPGDFESRGEAHYLKAKQAYEDAHDLAPANERAFRGLAKVHVVKDRWPDLQALAEDRIQRVPADPWGWMALGLARQRLKASADAAAAFDSGMARMTPELRAHLDRLDRVLRRRDSIAYGKSDSASQAKETAFAFLLAQPLWSTGTEKPRVEFLARIAFAEFRWSSPWNSVLGADTPKGQIYVRYGPPDMIQDKFWLFNSGLAFAFFTDGRANLVAPADGGLNARIKEWQPSRWDNIAETKIDSMPIQIARFRASTDSVDVFIATRAPMKALDTVAVVNAKPYANFWFSGLTSPYAFRDSLGLGGTGAMSWTRRISAGPYYYRVEAVVPGALQAGRAAASMMMGTDTATGFSMRGFAISDMIVASRVEATGTPKRWSDVDVTPLLTSIPRAGEISLVWETYEVGLTGTSARYSVAIKLLRQTPAPTFGGKIGARIVRGITGAAGVNRKEGSEGVTFRFERDVPYAPTLVDNVALSLEGTPPGEYVLRLEVTDRVTGRTTSRATGIVVRD